MSEQSDHEIQVDLGRLAYASKHGDPIVICGVRYVSEDDARLYGALRDIAQQVQVWRTIRADASPEQRHAAHRQALARIGEIVGRVHPGWSGS